MSHYVRLIEHASIESLAQAVAVQAQQALARALSTQSQAWLVASGGSTPKLYLPPIAQSDLDWSRVHVTLADERVVQATAEQSLRNELLLQSHFFQQGAAAHAVWHPLDGVNAAQWPTKFDVVFLGMGGDGHFASIFPTEPALQTLLAWHIGPTLTVEQSLAKTNAPTQMEPKVPRMTMSLARLLRTQCLILVMQGRDKKQLLQQAIAGQVQDIPVHALVQACEQYQVHMSVHVCD